MMVANTLGFMLGCDAVNLIQQSTLTVANEIKNTRVGPWKVLNNHVLSSVQCWHELSCYTLGEVTGYSNNTNIHNNQRGGVVADILEGVGAVICQGSGVLHMGCNASCQK